MHKTKPSFVADQLLDTDEIKYVKIVVFNDQNHVLAIKGKNRFVLPGGRIEWDDDDMEAAARHEVFETANITLSLVIPVKVVKTKDRHNQISQTMVFAGRMCRTDPTFGDNHRFLNKETFFETVGNQICSLIEDSYRVLTSEEIKGEYAETAQFGHEKYNFCSLL